MIWKIEKCSSAFELLSCLLRCGPVFLIFSFVLSIRRRHISFFGPLSCVSSERRYMWQQEKLMKHLPMVVEWNEPQKKLFLLWASTYIRPDRERLCVVLEKREKWKRLAGNNFVSVCVCAPRVVVVWRKWNIINWAWSPKKRKLHTNINCCEIHTTRSGLWVYRA